MQTLRQTGSGRTTAIAAGCCGQSLAMIRGLVPRLGRIVAVLTGLPGAWAAILVLAPVVAAAATSAQAGAPGEDLAGPYSDRATGGIRFVCPASAVPPVRAAMDRYLRDLKIRAAQYQRTVSNDGSVLTYTLRSPQGVFSTLALADAQGWPLREERVRLPARRGGITTVSTVSRQEIVLALMQHGRITEFAGTACAVQALADQVGIRQLVVAWSENLDWTFPDGRPAFWNEALWHRGTPKPGVPLEQAFRDPFLHQDRYSFGCYTAAKMVIAQAMLDYFSRVHPDARRLALVKARLLADGDPLVDVEPPAMWFFEDDFDPRERDRPGKLLFLRQNVPPKNFVPGDWAYIRNLDPGSMQRAGYEGSNALYLGRGRFDDFYNDIGHHYTYREKLNEVYQWRHGVFSRRRDRAKVEPFTAAMEILYGRTPDQGGLVLPYRAVPYLFGYQDLPAFVPAPDSARATDADHPANRALVAPDATTPNP